MLRLKRYRNSPYYYVRGTVARISIFQSTGTTDKGQAEAFRQRLERDTWERGALGRIQPATFGDAVNAYLDNGKPTRFILPLLDYFKDKALPEIGQAEIDGAAMAMHPLAKPATRVRQVYGPMVTVLKHAARARLPGAFRPDIVSPKVKRVPARWGTDAEIAAIMAHCTPRLRALVLLMTYTGLRIGEALRLRRPDFKARPGWVRIDRMKNDDAAMVPLTPETYDAVLAIMPDGMQPVFGYSTSQGVNQALRKAARASGLAHLSCHRIGRHSFAARLLNAGVDIKTVKEAGRWKKLAVVDETYGHLEIRRAHDAMLSVAKPLKISGASFPAKAESSKT